MELILNNFIVENKLYKKMTLQLSVKGKEGVKKLL